MPFISNKIINIIFNRGLIPIINPLLIAVLIFASNVYLSFFNTL